MIDVKIKTREIDIAPAPPGEKEIHKKFGLCVRSFGRYNQATPKDFVAPRQFLYYSLCHLIEGKAWYWSPHSGFSTFKAGDGVLSTPTSIQDYGGDHALFVEDYICFTGSLAERLETCGVLKPGIIHIGSNRRLLPIIEQSLQLGDEGQIAANFALLKFIGDLFKENRDMTHDPHENRLRELLEVVNSDLKHWWTVKEMSEYCHLSENHFRRLFKKQTGLSPKYYLEQLTIKHAAERLCNTSLKITTIATEFGYQDPYHFSKAFKKTTGLAPTTYRENYRINRDDTNQD